MSSHLESLIWQLKQLVPNKKRHNKLSKTIERVAKELKAINTTNFEAILPTRVVDMGARRIIWSEHTPGEDCEIPVTYTFTDPTNDETTQLSAKERDAAIEKVTEQIDELEALPHTEKRAARITALEELKDVMERADYEYEDLMWNTSWRPYDDDVDEDIAESIRGITWAKLLETDDQVAESFVALTTVGMCMAPSLMAYVILTHGVVPTEYVKYWTSAGERSYCDYVIGRRTFKACAEKLGVWPQLRRALRRDHLAKKRENAKADAERARKEAIKMRQLSRELRVQLRLALREDENVQLRKTWDRIAVICRVDDTDAYMKHPLFVEWNEVINAWDWHTWVSEVLDSFKPKKAAEPEVKTG